VEVVVVFMNQTPAVLVDLVVVVLDLVMEIQMVEMDLLELDLVVVEQREMLHLMLVLAVVELLFSDTLLTQLVLRVDKYLKT
tara:strand:- start:233 stop:478 length:246 start_codon:yes stop_codon:yes gene_type:complete